MAATPNQRPAKVVLVTGGSSGIGRATALEFAKLGHRVAITGRNQERLDQTLAELVQASGGGTRGAASEQHFLTIRADFEDERQVDGVVEQVVARFEQLDVLVNNAGHVGQNHHLLDEQFYSDFQSVLQVNLMASARLIQMAAPELLKRATESDPAVVINVSSIADRVAFGALAYCVSKAGLSMLTKTVACSLAGRPVRVLTVSPGPIRTAICPDERVLQHLGSRTLARRPGEPEEVANLIVFLASHKASYLHACTIDVDGGQVSNLGSLMTEGLGQRLTDSSS